MGIPRLPACETFAFDTVVASRMLRGFGIRRLTGCCLPGGWIIGILLRVPRLAAMENTQEIRLIAHFLSIVSFIKY